MLDPITLLLTFPRSLWSMLVTFLPGEIGYRLRTRYWRKRLRHLGRDVRIEIGVKFQRPEYIEIDDNCWIDRFVVILAGPDRSRREKVLRDNSDYTSDPGVVHVGKNVHVGINSILSGISSGIYISDDCGFSSNVKIYAFTHHYRSRRSPSDSRYSFGSITAHERQCMIEGPIVLGANTGVALNGTILPGVSIPKNCFIKINSVVTPRKFTSNSIIAGNPAEVISPRFRSDE